MKVVFLDRDGVINKFPGNGNYVTRVKDFHFIPGALDAIRILTEQGYTIFVVSNQAGVGKGVYSQAKLKQITRHMMKHIRKTKGRIKKIFYCTHRSDHGCECRKPEIGSIIRAFEIINKSTRYADRAFFIGDTEVDIKTGHNAGCRTIFVLSGRDNRQTSQRWKVRPDFIAKNLFEATKIIQNENSPHPRHRRGRASKGR